jgi:hypothetical protein
MSPQKNAVDQRQCSASKKAPQLLAIGEADSLNEERIRYAVNVN